MAELFAIRKETSRSTKLTLGIVAWVVVVLAWALVSKWELISSYVFPSPMGVLRAFPMLFSERGLMATCGPVGCASARHFCGAP